ncbi:hypothetical protein [Streptomyces sp. NPDC059788]|uniref:hypothetical protein n=1 Tax=Streptomyces sp. NPDC059788 TaxID=3346948 RepID=UPI003666064A
MTDDSPTKPFVLPRRPAPEQIRYASRKIIEVLEQIAHSAPGDQRYTLLGISGALDRVADEIEQQQDDTERIEELEVTVEYLKRNIRRSRNQVDGYDEALNTTNAAAARVRALHVRNEVAGYCNLCAEHGDIGWPCATIAALDKPGESEGMPVPLQHTGGNAEDCPLCKPEIDKTVLYPWICTGHTAKPACAECGHLADEHTEGDDPTSPGQCQQCVARGRTPPGTTTARPRRRDDVDRGSGGSEGRVTEIRILPRLLRKGDVITSDPRRDFTVRHLIADESGDVTINPDTGDQAFIHADQHVTVRQAGD